MNLDQKRSAVIERAQKIGREHGFTIGQAVAHPSDPMTYGFRGQHGDVGIVGFEDVEKEFPLAELFDPNAALREIPKLEMEEMGLDPETTFVLSV